MSKPAPFYKGIYNTIQYKYNLAHAKSVKLIDD